MPTLIAPGPRTRHPILCSPWNYSNYPIPRRTTKPSQTNFICDRSASLWGCSLPMCDLLWAEPGSILFWVLPSIYSSVSVLYLTIRRIFKSDNWHSEQDGMAITANSWIASYGSALGLQFCSKATREELDQELELPFSLGIYISACGGHHIFLRESSIQAVITG